MLPPVFRFAPSPNGLLHLGHARSALLNFDLARASGQDPELDEDYIAGAYAGMTGMADLIRGSGQFGVQQDVPADASVVEKFFAFIGRDPRWTP